ncbi:MAG: ribonuclease P protein component [Patescibacteria group bacterium]
MALSCIYRLKKKKEVEMALKSGRRRGGIAFRLFFYPNREARARYAFVISKKNLKKSVDRNRLRRLVTGWIQKNPKLLTPSFDIVCIFTPHAGQLTRKELYADFEKNFAFLS